MLYKQLKTSVNNYFSRLSLNIVISLQDKCQNGIFSGLSCTQLCHELDIAKI